MTRMWLIVVSLSAGASACTTVEPPALVPPKPAEREAERMSSFPRAHAPNVVEIRDFAVPTKGAFPYGVADAPDGSMWFSEQKGDEIDRFNPATGSFDRYPVSPGSEPRGIAVARDRTVWFAATGKSYVGRLDPATGVVAAYPLSDERATDPVAVVIAPNGDVWFTVERGNFIGRLDPGHPHIELAEVPTAHSHPESIVIGLGGDPFFTEFGTNQIGEVDRATMAIRQYQLPFGAKPRGISAARDGQLYYTDYARGKLGRLSPRTGDITEWPSPGGAVSNPYALAVAPDGNVWYVTTGVQPNEVVRFDPRNLSFEMTDMPEGGGLARSMVATPSGELFIACNEVDRVAIATPLGANVSNPRHLQVHQEADLGVR
jgi:virginiamycin B lyase